MAIIILSRHPTLTVKLQLRLICICLTDDYKISSFVDIYVNKGLSEVLNGKIMVTLIPYVFCSGECG